MVSLPVVQTRGRVLPERSQDGRVEARAVSGGMWQVEGVPKLVSRRPDLAASAGPPIRVLVELVVDAVDGKVDEDRPAAVGKWEFAGASPATCTLHEDEHRIAALVLSDRRREAARMELADDLVLHVAVELDTVLVDASPIPDDVVVLRESARLDDLDRVQGERPIRVLAAIERADLDERRPQVGGL